MDETQQMDNLTASAVRGGSTIAVAGDWHGNTRWARRCLRHLARLGVREVFHLGDFGVWPGPSGRRYVAEVERALAAEDMVLFVTPGNHEDYDQIQAVPPSDRGHDIGAVQWMTDHLALLPRGHRFRRHGWSVVSLGGAPSIDFEDRVRGEDWWPAEMITPDEIDSVVADGSADIMLAHDAPDADYATEAVSRILTGNPLGYGQVALAYCAVGRKRLTRAFMAVRPRAFVHGHFHVSDERTVAVDGWRHPTLAVSLGCDGDLRGNLALLHLSEQTVSSPPEVEWLDLGSSASHRSHG